MIRSAACFLFILAALLPTMSRGQTLDTTQVTTTISGVVGSVQPVDSVQGTTTLSGSVGITNNGFSIVPTFSLNSPAAIVNIYWRRKRFSFDPDIRLVPDASKGGFIFWFRYRLIEQKKFSLRVGVHPAFTLVKKTINENGSSSEITEMLRFAAAEVVPSYQLTKHWGISAIYLHGRGLQHHGPQRTHVFFLNNIISDIYVGGDLRLLLVPTLYHLYVDGHQGSYFSAAAILSKKGLPVTLQSTINQTLQSNIPGNKSFMWNVMLAYNFSKNFKQVL